MAEQKTTEQTTIIRTAETPEPSESELSLQEMIQNLQTKIEALEAKEPTAELSKLIARLESKIESLEAKMMTPEQARELLAAEEEQEQETPESEAQAGVTIVEVPQPPPVTPPVNAGDIKTNVNATPAAPAAKPEKSRLRKILLG